MNGPFEPEVLAWIADMVSTKIPFNRLINLKLEGVSQEGITTWFPMDERLLGNALHGMLHGGVISTVLDTTGGMAAWLGAFMKEERTLESATQKKKMLDQLARVATIDLRVDFLRPGRGTHFTANAFILRTGNRVAVTRMELRNDEPRLLAVGTGTYMLHSNSKRGEV